MRETSASGIYIHVPFCLRKCAYCDFFSLPLSSPEVLENYANCLLKEIYCRPANRKPIETIYFGGGTPSLLSASQLARIIKAVKENFPVERDAEISVEANPVTLCRDKISAMVEAGVNRISLGVQSFYDDELQVLQRMHSAREAMEAIELLLSANIHNFNLDLICGIPGQTMQSWEANLKKALQFAPAHISIYMLQLDPQTPLAVAINKGMLKTPGEDIEAEMYLLGIDMLEESGFEHYEISNWCRPGFKCRHNLLYWQAREYVGLGPGAVSFTNKARYKNVPDLSEYQESIFKQHCPAECLEKMNSEQLAADALILGLRLCQGVALQEYGEKYGIDIIEVYGKIINVFINEGLLNIVNGHLRFTKRGYLLSNQVLCQFIA